MTMAALTYKALSPLGLGIDAKFYCALCPLAPKHTKDGPPTARIFNNDDTCGVGA